MPTGPSSEIPPKTENKIRMGCKSILLPTITGFKILSIVPTNAIPQIARPIALTMFPVAKRNIMAGMVTSPLPIVGMRAVIMATKPQRAGLGTPKIANPMLTNIP